MAVGASTILGSFAARLGIDTNEYAKGMLQAQAVTHVFGQSFATFVTNPLLGSVDLFKKTVGHFLGVAESVLGTAEELQRLNQITGVSTPVLQALRGKMDEASGSGDKLSAALRKMNQQLVIGGETGGPVADLFKKLGVDLDNLGSSDEALVAIIEGISKLDTEAKRTTASMVVFGEEAGPALINAVGGGRDALRELMAAASDTGRIWKQEWIDPLAQGNTDLGNARQAIIDLQRVLVAGFLAGFLKEFGSGEEAIRMFASRLQDELIPTLEQVGRDLATVTGNAAEATRAVSDFFDAIGSAKTAAPYAWEGFKQDTIVGQMINAAQNPQTPAQKLDYWNQLFITGGPAR